MLVAAAESLGELWYRRAPERAAQARANLRRVCEGLAAQGRGTPLARISRTLPPFAAPNPLSCEPKAGFVEKLPSRLTVKSNALPS